MTDTSGGAARAEALGAAVTVAAGAALGATSAVIADPASAGASDAAAAGAGAWARVAGVSTVPFVSAVGTGAGLAGKFRHQATPATMSSRTRMMEAMFFFRIFITLEC